MAPTYDDQEPLWDARDGLVQYGAVTFHELAQRLYAALPTSSHARRFAELVLEQLGDRGRVDPYTDGDRLAVVCAAPRDPAGWWLRAPPVTYYAGIPFKAMRVGNDVPAYPRPADAPEGWTGGLGFRPQPPRPAIAPDAGLGVVTLRTGGAVVELRYGDDGLLTDDPLFLFGDHWAHHRWDALWPPTLDPRARPPQVPPPSWFVQLPADPPTLDEFASFFLRHLTASDPVRVRMRVDAPGGVEGCWEQARRKLRKLAWDEALPTEGGVYLVDAFNNDPDAACVASGPDLAAAERAWREVQRRERPRPKPEPPPRPPPTRAPAATHETEVFELDGSKTTVVTTTQRFVFAPLRDIPVPIPGPETTPLVAVRFPPMRRDIPDAWRDAGYTRWRYMIGETGDVGFGLVRDEDDGVTEIGQWLIDALDPAAVDAALASAGPVDWGPLADLSFGDHPFETTCYRAWSNLYRAPKTPIREAAHRGPHPDWSSRCFDYHAVQIRRERRS
jgi:hypothetical protein